MQEQNATGNFCAPKKMLTKKDPLRKCDIQSESLNLKGNITPAKGWDNKVPLLNYYPTLKKVRSLNKKGKGQQLESVISKFAMGKITLVQG